MAAWRGLPAMQRELLSEAVIHFRENKEQSGISLPGPWAASSLPSRGSTQFPLAPVLTSRWECKLHHGKRSAQRFCFSPPLTIFCLLSLSQASRSGARTPRPRWR